MKLSVVIPVFNEQDNIILLFNAVSEALSGIEHEVVFVDDGSFDETVAKILAIDEPNVKLICFARNYGQTSAIAAGIEYADGDYIATLDGDLQNDPNDIPLMLDKLLAENLDVVAGRRAKRKDGMLLRKIPSLIANWIIRKTTKVTISDYGCTLKIFRKQIAKKLDLYGELHRFIPLLSSLYGAKIAEMDVRHHPRRYGSSKYGINRTFKVISDLSLMLFFLKYRQKPMHLFGTLGIASFTLGALIEFYLLMLKFSGEDIGTRPLFYVGILLIIMSIQFITTGFLAEINMRTYFESQNKKPYSINKIYQNGKEI